MCIGSRCGAFRGVLLTCALASLGALAACLVLRCHGSLPTDPTIQSNASLHAGDVQGAWVTYRPQDGKFSFEPFLKVADKDALDQDGRSEVWGFRVWNLESPDEYGKTHPVNIPAAQFIPCDGRMHEVEAGTARRMVRCPDGYWGR